MVMSMTYETLLVRVDEDVAHVTLNRPQVLNAMNAKMFDELELAFRELAAREDVRVILLTGAGEKAFAAGTDIRELQGLDVAGGEKKAERGQEVLDLVETCGKPVIALINGFALGGGCELAMACTLRIAADGAKLGQPEVKLGLLPGYGGSQRLPRLVGQSAALKMLITGEMVGAAEALRLKLVDEVVPGDQLQERGEELAKVIAAGAPLAIKACMDAVQRGSEMSLEDAQGVEAKLFGELFGTEDTKEGLRAFVEKQKPKWAAR
jgi:enoyl-CoA hydratase